MNCIKIIYIIYIKHNKLYRFYVPSSIVMNIKYKKVMNIRK
jgi:hypothetical protein